MTSKRTIALEQIYKLREEEALLIKQFDNNPTRRDEIRLKIKDNFDEQMNIILSHNPPLSIEK